MIATFIGNLILHYGLQVLVGLLAIFGAKKLKDAVLGSKADRSPEQAHDLAQAVVQNHQVASQAGAAKTKEEADAALDALADSDRR